MSALTTRTRTGESCLPMVAAALAGCGGSSSGNGVAAKSPTEILAAARAAAESASSLAEQIGQGSSISSASVDLVGSRGGRDQFSPVVVLKSGQQNQITFSKRNEPVSLSPPQNVVAVSQILGTGH